MVSRLSKLIVVKLTVDQCVNLYNTVIIMTITFRCLSIRLHFMLIFKFERASDKIIIIIITNMHIVFFIYQDGLLFLVMCYI